ncbi:DUF6555 family protein [Pseudomonas coleopterorum]|uniref:DUF6555 family protein n=1 Tax=Pseudomonas coleopterorum TaxID=1605838 RepID=UPI003B9685D1
MSIKQSAASATRSVKPLSLYELRYYIDSQEVTVLVSCDIMDEDRAWHWAACHAGVGLLLRSEKEVTMLANRQNALRYGIENVKWRKC